MSEINLDGFCEAANKERGERRQQNVDIVDRLQIEIVKVLNGDPETPTYAATTMACAKAEIVRLRVLVAANCGEKS